MITSQKKTNERPVVLVAGGARFIGSFLCEILLLQNCKVICIDNFSTGKKENLKKCLANPDFTFLNFDLRKFSLEKFKEPVAYIFDLADNKEATKNLLELAQKTVAKFLLVCHRGFSLEDLIKNFPQVDFRIVYITDVYGPRMNYKNINLLTQEISQTRYLFITDAVFGITKAMFSSGTTGKSFYLTTEGEEKLNWQPKVDLEEGLEQTFRFFAGKIQKKPQKTSSKPRKQKSLSWFFLVFLFFLIFTPIASFFFEGYLGIKNLKKAQKEILIADFKKARSSSLNAQNFFRSGERKIYWLRGRGGLEKPFYLGRQLAQGLFHLSLVGENSNDLAREIFQEGEINKSISNIKVELSQAYYHLSLAEGELKTSSFSPRLDLPNLELPQIRNLIAQAEKGIEVLSQIIGQKQKQSFLVLLQNNSELRPTGGFIGSFALLTFEKGKFLDFEVQDVYWADGQLKGHVEPPPELKKYLGEANWYLRDSNWSPDFSVSAQRAAWFLEKETGRVIDGVFGVNLFLTQRLLEAVGEVELPDYKEKITDSNLFERAEYYSEIGFFPGSTQKQDFLGSLSRALFEKIKKAEGKTQIEIAKAIYQSLKSKDFLVYLNNSQAMEVISEFGWDGKIKNVPTLKCSNAQCFTDYLMIVEANVGVNKANYFLKRELNHKVNVGENGEIRGILKITYQNDSPSEKFPGGRYKNYLRILVPLGSDLGKVLIDGQELSLEKIDISSIASKTSFGFLVEVPVKEKKVVEISYRLEEKIQLAEKSQYLLLVQKQSGTKEERFNLKVSVPSGVVVLPDTYLFTPDFQQDIVFEVFLVR